MFKGAIFDLDGVIVNTVPLHFKAWKRMFEEYGHSFSMDDYLHGAFKYFHRFHVKKFQVI